METSKPKPSGSTKSNKIFVVTPVSSDSSKDLQDEFAAAADKLSPKLDFGESSNQELKIPNINDQVPDSYSTIIPTDTTEEDFIKSLVIEVDSSDSDLDADDHRRGTPISLKPDACKGYLNVCMDRESQDDTFSAQRRLEAQQSQRIGKYERAGLRGLVNIGNTCFMNSILQCLSNTSPLLRYILKDKFIPEVNKEGSLKGNLLAAFVKLIKEVWKSDSTHPVDTSSLKAQLQIFAPRFKGYAQHDSQELLRYLLDALHAELNRVRGKPKYVTFEIQGSWNLATHSINAWKHYTRRDNSQIVDIFVGQLRSTLCCCECRQTSIKFDPFWDLSISIPSPRMGSSEVSLEQCLNAFTKEEILDGNERAFCEKCKKLQKTTKNLTIERFPEVLVIHLKRFRDEAKLRTIVRFPLLGLDIGPYSSSKTNCCSYNLYGISNHSGYVSAGHYIAYCKHPYNGHWSCYDDTRVVPTTSKVVSESEAYVLFYEMSEGSKSVLF